MKKIYITLLLLSAIAASAPSLKAQQTLKYTPVDFEILNLGIFNDTIFFMRVKFMEKIASPGGSNLFSGTITVSMCNCYCDSIWDAWPSGANGATGTGTIMTAISSSSTGSGSPGLGSGGASRMRGALGIQSVTGGILRKDEFVVAGTIRLGD